MMTDPRIARLENIIAVWRANDTAFEDALHGLFRPRVLPILGAQLGPLATRTAGAAYTATEQTMIQEAHDTIRVLLTYILAKDGWS